MNENIQDNFEFLTGLTYSGDEYLGIVVNQDNQLLTFYDMGVIAHPELRREFLEMGELWWWESNRQLPIDVFLHHEMQAFRFCMKTFVMKDVEIQFGPVTSLQNLLKKRIKRRSIQLIRKTH
jgi:hypothetical protein